AGFDNVRVRRLDMMHINAKDNTFDKVIAGNVIHLLDDPEAAVRELARVCKKGGKLIIPTYIGGENKKASALSSFVILMGAHFREKYTLDSYADLFDRMGFEEITITIADGMIPCAVAVITK
ncbi:MAG: methyltransferase domain-containing protein, partial [Oscillospiraceae bacterium]|nr:methyltransferase domain-containing protein [Oscillospiraceae bacterium]